MKHVGSCLPDVAFSIDVDERRRHVVAKSECFDSALVASLVTQVLPEEFGVVAYRDDNVDWSAPPAPYSLELRFGGMRFGASVVKLRSAVGVSTVATRLSVLTFDDRSSTVSRRRRDASPQHDEPVNPSSVEGEVLEVLPEFGLAHVRGSDGHVYGLTAETPGIPFDQLHSGARVHMTVTTRFRRVLHARLIE